LLAAYTPQLRYDDMETYRADHPAEIAENYVNTNRKTVLTNLLKSSSGATIATSDPAAKGADLNLAFLGPRYPTGATASATDYLSENDAYAADFQRLHSLPGYRNFVAGRVKSLADGTKILQYHLFYYYNPKTYLTRGTHEGDWEMVQVHLDADQTPLRATYAQHENGERCDWIHVPRTADGRPIVYVAEGSHASYFSSGYHLNGGANDTSGGQITEQPTLIALTDEPGWLNWPGRWGDTRGVIPMDPDSPAGPKFQGAKWSDPVSWASGVDGCTEGQTFTSTARRAAATTSTT
jgi:hypothetical protein